MNTQKRLRDFFLLTSRNPKILPLCGFKWGPIYLMVRKNLGKKSSLMSGIKWWPICVMVRKKSWYR